MNTTHFLEWLIADSELSILRPFNCNAIDDCELNTLSSVNCYKASQVLCSYWRRKAYLLLSILRTPQATTMFVGSILRLKHFHIYCFLCTATRRFAEARIKESKPSGIRARRVIFEETMFPQYDTLSKLRESFVLGTCRGANRGLI